MASNAATRGGRRHAAASLAGVQALALLAALGFLSRWQLPPWRDLEAATPTATYTIYPRWTFLLALAGLVLAGWAAWAARRRPHDSLVVAATVLGAMVVGTGAVAWRHWRPAFGMQEHWRGELPELRAYAVGLVLAGVVAVVMGLAYLALRGGFTWQGSPAATAVLCLAGLAVILGVPAAVTSLSTDDARAVTIFGATGLAYSGPWGAAIIAAAWLRPPLARAALVTVASTAALTAFGPHITVAADETWLPLAVVALLAVCLLPVPRLARPSVAPQPAG